ncbi:hypothetical protein [Roseibium sp. Sym1]|uniref:hypothetical protein n=1 Tax=Roseibium sp. Sym1 TaxID=3016006 RepID=UPI0022B55C17|nr:hypothetical protein [Roseibium sp. Sym1]
MSKNINPFPNAFSAVADFGAESRKSVFHTPADRILGHEAPDALFRGSNDAFPAANGGGDNLHGDAAAEAMSGDSPEGEGDRLSGGNSTVREGRGGKFLRHRKAGNDTPRGVSDTLIFTAGEDKTTAGRGACPFLLRDLASVTANHFDFFQRSSATRLYVAPETGSDHPQSRLR